MAIVNISNAMKTSFVTDLNTALGTGATMAFYTGSMPAGPDVSPSVAAIASVPFASSGSFGTVSGSVLTASGLPSQGLVSDPGGVVTWARLSNSAGTAVVDVDVGTSGTTVIVANTTVSSGNYLQIASCSFQAN